MRNMKVISQILDGIMYMWYYFMARLFRFIIHDLKKNI